MVVPTFISIFYMCALRHYSNQACSLGLDVSVSRRFRDLLSEHLGVVSVSGNGGKVSISSPTESLMCQSRLGLVP